MASGGKLLGKVALVTGGAGGIGSLVCVGLAEQGAAVVVVDVVSAEEVASKIKGGGGKAIAVKADLTKSADVAGAFDKAVEAFGAVHIVVHMAAILLHEYPMLESTSEEDWDKVFSVNCKGSFLVAREAANRLGPGGRIVLTSSKLAMRPLPGLGAYCCTKAAVECLVKALATELAGRRITVNAIAPGPVNTSMLMTNLPPETLDGLLQGCPLGRLGEPTDILPLVSFLVSEEGEWVNGEICGAAGGLYAGGV